MRTEERDRRDDRTPEPPAKPRGAFSSWLSGIRGKQSKASNGQDRANTTPEEEAEMEMEPEPIPTDWMPSFGNFLDKLREGEVDAASAVPKGERPAWDNTPPETPEVTEAEPVLYSSFTLDGKEPDKEKKKFINELQSKAHQRMDSKEPLDAECEIKISQNGMEAWAFIFPPQGGGSQIKAEDLKNALAEKGVVYGIDEKILGRLVRGRSYFRLAVVAHGLAPVDAEDGRIVDHFPRENNISLQKDDGKPIDYKDLNWLHQVKTGDVLCDILPPTEQTPGCTVAGRNVNGKAGKKAFVPKGKETAVNEDGTCLVALVDGMVSFKAGKFQVVQMISIPGNVDNSTGNLDVLGDVIIAGDVLEGFIVKASGNVIIQGMSEGATIIAGGNAQIGKGMNGNSHGSLYAGGDVAAKFLENCYVQANGCVSADSAVNCNIISNDKVHITTGRGAIIGGTIMALNEIEAKIVGNQSNRSNTLALGNTPTFQQEKTEVSEEIKRLSKEQDEMEKNLQYLERVNNLPPEHQALRSQLRLQLSVTKMQYARATKRLEEMEQQQMDVSQCRLRCGIIYPLTQITIGHDTRIISATIRQCNIFYGPEGVTIGTY